MASPSYDLRSWGSLDLNDHLSQLMRFWHLSPSVNSIFKHACAAIHLGLHVWFLVRPFVFFHTLCVRTAMARLRGCAVSPGLSLFAYTISTMISWTGSFENSLPPWTTLSNCPSANNLSALLKPLSKVSNNLNLVSQFQNMKAGVAGLGITRSQTYTTAEGDTNR